MRTVGGEIRRVFQIRTCGHPNCLAPRGLSHPDLRGASTNDRSVRKELPIPRENGPPASGRYKSGWGQVGSWGCLQPRDGRDADSREQNGYRQRSEEATREADVSDLDSAGSAADSGITAAAGVGRFGRRDLRYYWRDKSVSSPRDRFNILRCAGIVINASRIRFIALFRRMIEINEGICPILRCSCSRVTISPGRSANIANTRQGCSCSRISLPFFRNSMADRSSSYIPKRSLADIRPPLSATLRQMSQNFAGQMEQLQFR